VLCQIAGCSKTFCHYDDYNWDWTLEATLYGGNRDAASCPALHASASPPAALVLQVGDADQILCVAFCSFCCCCC
jgi:hypothetical protein